jgi:hypothetical protein
MSLAHLPGRRKDFEIRVVSSMLMEMERRATWPAGKSPIKLEVYPLVN